MTTITLRNTKGSPLTNTEVDANFTNLNNNKVEKTSSTGSAIIPAGTNAQRDGTPSEGYFRYNSEIDRLEYYKDASWEPVPNVLNDLDNLNVGSPSGGSVLIYNSSSSEWKDGKISSTQMDTLSTLLIKNSAGTTLKTIHGAGA